METIHKRRLQKELSLLCCTISLSLATIAQAPIISAFSPVAGPIGSAVTITGSNFSPIAANDIVYFGGVKANVTAATANMLTVTVPGGATLQPIAVTTNNLTAYSTKSFITTFTGGSKTFSSASFTSLSTLTTGLDPYGICAADLDGDGKPDLVTANNANSPSLSTISVLRNTGTTGSLSFAAQTTLPTPAGSYPYNMITADIDGDGKPDLIFPSVLTNTVSVYRNISIPGTIAFATRVDFVTDINPYSVAIGDFDGDGKPDMVVTNFLSSTISVFKNTSSPGSISFSAKVDWATPFGPHSVAVADLDGDGKPDVAVTNTLSSSISLFRNQSSVGNLVFAVRVDVPTGADEPFGLAITDMDGDGKPDLIMTNDNFNVVNEAVVAVSLFKNNSSIGVLSFGTPLNVGSGNAFNPAIGDLNGDGKPDLVIPSDNTSVIIYPNASVPGSIVLATPVSYFDESPYVAAICALGGDSLPELAIANFNASTISLFRSTTTAVGISRFYPAAALPGGNDTIIGVNFTGATAVTFGAHAAASFTVISDTMIIAVVGTGATGSVAITTPKGNTYLEGFLLAGMPTVSSIYPTDASEGQSVIITGTNFDGVSSVTFGGMAASSFIENSPTTITAIVNAGTSGDVAVTTPGGTAAAPGFFYTGPSISSFSPSAGTAGTLITITGTNFTGTPSITFGGVPAASFTILSSTTMQAVVGIGTSGNLVYGSVSGTATSPGFVYTGPSISTLTPAFGGPGTVVTLTGINFNNASAVSFGGTATTSFAVVDSTTIRAVVGAGGSGAINVVTPNGTATFPGFNFTTYPAIASFSPASANIGTAVTIQGSDFNPDPAQNSVFFGAVKAAVTSATTNSIVATIPVGADYEPIQLLTGGQIAASRNPVVVTFPGAGPTFTTHSFDGPANFLVDSVPEDLVICDFDGDGKPDVVIGCANGVAIRRNTSRTGFVSFAPKLDIHGTYMPQYMTTGDIDGDGKPDLVVADYSTVGAIVSIYKNISTPGVIAFTPRINLTLTSVGRVALADMDGDGKLDLIALDWFPGVSAHILRNTSDGENISFGQPLTFQPFIGGVASEMAIGDLDGDGRPDLALLCGSYLAIMTNTSSPGTISVQFPGMMLPTSGIDLALADLDGDGRPDLAVADPGDESGQGSVVIYPNKSIPGTISFPGTISVPTTLNSESWRVAVNDMDGDGKPDLVVSNLGNNSISIFKSTCSPGNFSFTASANFVLKSVPWLSRTGDLDGDGKPEIVVSDNGGTYPSDSISIFRNMTGLSLSPVTLVKGSPVICQGDTVTITSSSSANNQWYLNGQAISGATNPVLPVTAAGVYTVTTFLPGTTSAPSAGDTITVTPAPAKPSITLVTSEGLLSSADSGNQWYVDTTSMISGAMGQVYKPLDSGYYSVRVTDNGCPSPFSDTLYYHLPPGPDTTSVPAGHAIAAPNPVINSLPQIIYHFPGVTGLEAELSDMNGKIILVQPNLQSGDYLNLIGHAKGLYVLTLRDSSGKKYAAISIVKL